MPTTPGFETTVGVLDPTASSEPVGEHKPELARGEMVGRYEIIRLLGRGGMGVVYAARDPKLDRQIAVKLLHSARGTDAGERMIHEAQALARLDDPHVVQVYDAGEYGESVFIAMQLVDGEDLGVALARRRASVTQILSWFVDAGRGLAAAHAAGLVHRDFKPNNVLIDRRGRVQVTDFGLARDLAQRPGAGLTKLGAIMGTPAYMSPEQHNAQEATEASDQFSFCVALWEAVFDRHPFLGERAAIGQMSPYEIGYVIYDGPLLPPPKSRRVPRRVVDALLRGLERDPAKRWPAMTELLAVIAPVQTRRLWPIIAGAGAVAAAAGGVAMWLASSHESAAPTCASKASERAATAWSPVAAKQIDAQFAKTGRSYAGIAVAELESTLDAYSTRWQHLQSDVCAAERAAVGPLPELEVRRRACLDGRLDALRGLVALLAAEARPEFVDHASGMVAALPELSDCTESASLLAAPGLPPPAITAVVLQLDARVNAANALTAAGDYKRAVDDVTAIVKRVDELAWPPLQVHLHETLGELHLNAIEPAREELMKAAELAIANHMDREAARALAQAAMAAAIDQAPGAFNTLVPLARAAAARTKDPLAAVGAEIARGRGLARLRRYQEGADACRHALATARTLGKKAMIGDARMCMVETLVPLGDTKELEPLLAQVVADSTKELGPDHPQVADYLGVQVGLALSAGRLVEARKLAEHVLDVRRRAFPARHLKIAMALRGLGEVAAAENKSAEAFALYQQALAITDETKPEQLVLIQSLLVSIANYEYSTKHHADGIAHYERAVALVKKVSGPDSTELAILLLNYGQIMGHENVDAGLSLIADARRILELKHDPRAGVAGIASAIVASDAKRWPAARKAAEDAMPFAGPDGDPEQHATVIWILAKALAETHGDLGRARKLAAEARIIFTKLGPGFHEPKEIDAWLKKH